MGERKLGSLQRKTSDLAKPGQKNPPKDKGAKTKILAFDALGGPGVFVFPSHLPKDYYGRVIQAVVKKDRELKKKYPRGDLWKTFTGRGNPPLEEYYLTDEALMKPLDELATTVEKRIKPQVDPAFQVCETEYLTVRWYTGEPDSIGSFFKFNPVKRRMELFKYNRRPFVEIHCDPGKSIVSSHICHIKLCITLTPFGPKGEIIAKNRTEVGTLYDPMGCRRFEGRNFLKASDLAATPTMDVVSFLTTKGASVFNQYVKKKYFDDPDAKIPHDFVPARGVKHRAAAQRAPLFKPKKNEPFAPRVILHGGVHLRRKNRTRLGYEGFNF